MVPVSFGLARGSLDGYEIAGLPLVVTGRTEVEMAEARAGVLRQIAFYGSTPAYRTVLELHGWGELGNELNVLSRQDRWAEMPLLLDDEVLHAFAVVAEPEQVAPELVRRYGDLMTRMTLYTPYDFDPDLGMQIAAEVRALTSTVTKENEPAWT